MATLNHPYFGLLDSDALADEVDVLWERGVDVNGHSVNAQLWAAAEAELDASELDQFAARLKNLAELDQRARAALQKYLADEGSGPLVLDYMIDSDNSDEILAVSVAADGKIEEINWES